MSKARINNELAQAVVNLRNSPDFQKFVSYLKQHQIDTDKELRDAPKGFVEYMQGKAQFLEQLLLEIDEAHERLK